MPGRAQPPGLAQPPGRASAAVRGSAASAPVPPARAADGQTVPHGQQHPEASGSIHLGTAQSPDASGAYRSGGPGITHDGAYRPGRHPEDSGGSPSGALAVGHSPEASRTGRRPESADDPQSPGTGLAHRPPNTVARIKPLSVVPSQPEKPESLATEAAQRPTAGSTDEAGPAAEPRKPWQLLVGVLAALVLVSVCGLSSFFILADERSGGDARASNANPQATTLPRDITSRSVDGEPLTTNEVFPGDTIAIIASEKPYQVLKTEQLDDCGKAAAGEIPQLIIDLGCTQVVRGTMRSPDSGYLVTAGVFNLEDETGAKWAHEQIKAMVDGQKGRFSGMNAGAGTEAVELSSAQVGWNIRGHYLAYCVIARADGEKIIDGDPEARRILYDMVELHLRNNVLEKRATQPITN